MILVAGIAAGLALAHDFHLRTPRMMGDFGVGMPGWLVSGCFVLRGLSLAALVVSLRPPHASLRRLGGRVGFTALVADAVAAAIGLGIVAVLAGCVRSQPRGCLLCHLRMREPHQHLCRVVRVASK